MLHREVLALVSGAGHYRFDLFWCNNLKDEIANNKEVTRLSFDNDFFRNLVGGSKGCISVDGTSVPNRRSGTSSGSDAAKAGSIATLVNAVAQMRLIAILPFFMLYHPFTIKII